MTAFRTLAPQAIRAAGWLHEQLRLSAVGLSGRLMEVWPDVGADSAWLGGGGERWERGPYYARGLVALAHALGDAALQRRAAAWIEAGLASQRADGDFGPADGDDWWPRMPMLEALRWHAEATGDARVAPFLERYFRHQLTRLPQHPLHFWATPRGGDNLDAVLWLHARSGAAWLLELADLLHAQTSNWLGELAGDGPPNETFDFGHGVNLAMGLKFPALWARRTGDATHLVALRRGWQRLLAHHGQVSGIYSCDEFLHGRAPTQGAELCTVVELLSSFETALTVGGEAWLGDAIERLAYNALPAMLSADHCTHQYFQLANQIECTPGNRAFSVAHETDLLFGVAPGYGCCAANYHMGWPRLVQHLWLASDDGLCAALLAPSRVSAQLGGQSVTIEEATDYPFGGDVLFTIRTAQPVRFTLSLRIPGWAEGGMVEGPGARAVRPPAGALHHITETFRDGDRVRLHLPMPVRATRWDDGVVIERGPLVYALPIREDWRAIGGTPPFADYELHPTTAWNYALAVDLTAPARDIAVERRPGAAQPWSADGTPVRLHVPARRVPGWTAAGGVAGPLPVAPFGLDPVEETVALVPYGAARLRIALFPHAR